MYVCFLLHLSGIVTCAFDQGLSDWVETISKALSTLQSAQANSRNTEITPSTLTDDQRRGRELYLFAEKHERNSKASQIYANVGLACLGIRRLLQACYPLLDYLLLLTLVLGSVGYPPQERGSD
jgi:hypothetical protein